MKSNKLANSRSAIGLDPAPPRQQAAAWHVKGKYITAPLARLIVGTTDRRAFHVTKQQGADAAMGDDGDVTFSRCHGDDVLDCVDNAPLRIDRALLSTHALLRLSEEVIGHRFELRLRQIAGRGSIILAQRFDDYRRKPKMHGHYTGCLTRLPFGAAKDGTCSVEPWLLECKAHALRSKRRQRPVRDRHGRIDCHLGMRHEVDGRHVTLPMV